MPQNIYYANQSNHPQQQAPQAYMPWQQGQSGFKGMSDNAYQSGVNAQASKDNAAFGAYQNLGIAGQNAMAQYGANQSNALVNSQIAQTNALGQMGIGYYNTLGQFGQANAGMVAAASQAGADTNKASAVAGLASGVLNAGMYGAQAAAYGMGNMPNFGSGGGGRGGFRASGPEGAIASGGWGGGQQFNAPPSPPYASGYNAPTYNPYEPFRQGSKNLQQMMGMMQSPNSMPNLARQDMNAAFNTTQKNLMDPGIRDSLNGQMAMGYGALSNLYGKSDYGFNSGNKPFSPRHYSPQSQQRFMY